MIAKISPILIKNDFNAFCSAFLAALLIFSSFYFYVAYADTAPITLSVSVSSSMSFSQSTNQFAALIPGAPVWATTTLSMTTNNTSGWNVTLYGDNVTLTAKVMNDGGSNELADLSPYWSVPAANATTSGGNATTISSGNDVLAFRVMSASSTNGTAFLSTGWWGTSDVDFNGSQKWAGIPSSTNASRIGNAGTGSYSASAHLNTVKYYLDAPSSQITGTYTGPLTYSATANP